MAYTFSFPKEYHDVQFLIFGTLCGYMFYSMSEVSGAGIGLKERQYITYLSQLYQYWLA